MPLQPGYLLNDRYRVEKQLGQGGMGAVYQAIDTLRDQPCAIKELRLDGLLGFDDATNSGEAQSSYDLTAVHPVTSVEPGGATLTHADATLHRAGSRMLARDAAITQFRDAAKLLDKLVHPGLTAVMDYFASSDAYYLVTALVDKGEDLAARLEREVNGRISEGEVLELIDQVLVILAYCHAQSVIHRDIKPENIIVCQDRKVFLVDFGIAQPLGRDGKVLPGLNAVSKGYSPPEQYEGRADKSSDIYAVGATLYALLTGRTPPSAQDRIKTVPLQPPSRLVGSITPQIDAVVLKAMSLDPAARYGSAEEMRASLPPVGRLSRMDAFVLGARVGTVIWSVVASTARVRLVAGCSDKTVKVWDLVRHQLLRTLSGHSGYIYSVCCSPDGKLLASGSSDGIVKVWNLETGKDQRTYNRQAGAALCVAFSPNSEFVAVGYDEAMLRLWAQRPGQPDRVLDGHQGHVFSIAFSPDGRLLISGASDGQVILRHLATEESVILQPTGQVAVRSLAVSPNGRWVAASDMEGWITVWDLQKSDAPRRFRSDRPPVWSLSFSPDSRWLAEAWNDGIIVLRDVESGFPLPLSLAGHAKTVRSLSFAPVIPKGEGSRMVLASGSDDGTLRLWWLE